MRSNRWFILAVLFVTRFCLGYQFQSAGSVAPFLISEFALDYRQIGTLVGLFMLPGLVFALPGGLLGQRFGDKPMVMMGMAAMIVGGLLSGVAQSYVVISVGRVISGVGAVFLVVLMAKMVTDWFAGKELFLGMAIFIIGWPVGIAAAQATQAHLAEAEGWSAVFILTAIMMTIALASMAVFYRDAPAGVDVSVSRLARLDRDELWLVCILHGEGGDGQSIINQALNWAPTMPKADFVAVEAPFPCVGAASGRQWLDSGDMTPAAISAGLRTAAPLLDQFLDDHGHHEHEHH